MPGAVARTSDTPRVLIAHTDPDEVRTLRELVLHRFPDLVVDTASTDDEVAGLLPRANVVFGTSLAARHLDSARQLRWFQTMSAGIDFLAGAPHTPHPVTFTNLKGVFGNAMAEYALAYMLAHAQHIRGVIEDDQRHEWHRFTPDLLQHKTAGIAGLGSIGREVAQRCHAFGMRTVGLKRSPGQVDQVEAVFTMQNIDAFLAECDYLILVLPQTPETMGSLSRERLSNLKRGCFLVNIGRGSVVAEADLIWALEQQILSGAALDVFETEPLPPDSQLWGIDGVFITAHISGVNRPDEIVQPFLRNIERYLADEPLESVVDPHRGY